MHGSIAQRRGVGGVPQRGIVEERISQLLYGVRTGVGGGACSVHAGGWWGAAGWVGLISGLGVGAGSARLSFGVLERIDARGVGRPGRWSKRPCSRRYSPPPRKDGLAPFQKPKYGLSQNVIYGTWMLSGS